MTSPGFEPNILSSRSRVLDCPKLSLQVICVALSARTYQIRSGVSNASDLVIIRPPVVENLHLPVAVKWDTTAQNAMVRKNVSIAKVTTYRTHLIKLTYPEARLAVTNRTPVQDLSYAVQQPKVYQKLKYTNESSNNT
ncbi:hypothetical protein TNCT_71511 [Trichonephila clavata]|uniref:Uncharacterized protein n=1 Tax=Trichonephila clavata TaxID=2740835 RepID=A0A8X6GF84_TRICU|nr:hypothetical protein TNCT_71511 [Trichonephila clavata]